MAIDWIEECGLAATISKAEVECLGDLAPLWSAVPRRRRISWPLEVEDVAPKALPALGETVSFGPLQIRTFKIHLAAPVVI